VRFLARSYSSSQALTFKARSNGVRLDEEPTMYVLSWLFAMMIALLATSTIVFALPQSASDELSAATAPQSIFSVETNRASTMIASCATDQD
jgi:hypothetical protein